MGSPAPAPPGSQPASPHPQMQPNGGGALVDPVGVMPTGPGAAAAALVGAEQQVAAAQYTAMHTMSSIPLSPTTHLETLTLVEQNR